MRKSRLEEMLEALLSFHATFTLIALLAAGAMLIAIPLVFKIPT